MTARTPKAPKRGTIALAGLPILEDADAPLSPAQAARLTAAVDAICGAGANVPPVVLGALYGLAAQTPREAPPGPVEAPDRWVCGWCGQSQEPDDSPVAWPDVEPIAGFCAQDCCAQDCWEAAEAAAEAAAGAPRCRRCGAPYPPHETDDDARDYGSVACLDAAEADAEARHQAAKDRAREPDRWRPGREED